MNKRTKMKKVEEKKEELFIPLSEKIEVPKPAIVEKEEVKPLRFREMLIYIWFGMLLGLNVALGVILYNNRVEYFNLAVDLSKTIAFGFLLLKGLILIAVLVLDAKTLSSVMKVWQRHRGRPKVKPTIEGEEGYKRMGFMRKAWFYWRVSEARKYMDKYHEVFRKLQRAVGRIKGDETKELKAAKRELIKGILIWKDDFAVRELEIDKDKNSPTYGKKIPTNKPATEEFLNEKHLDELYEDYQVRCIDSADKFVNGVTPDEILEDI